MGNISAFYTVILITCAYGEKQSNRSFALGGGGIEQEVNVPQETILFILPNEGYIRLAPGAPVP